MVFTLEISSPVSIIVVETSTSISPLIKSKVKGAVKNIAKELVKLYAVRQEKEGYVCGPDTVWQREFEEMFPYEETEDQLNAIEDTKRDMESTGNSFILWINVL